MKLKTLAR